MSSALETFTGGGAMPVDVAQIERQLRALWQQGGETVSRACLFNLVVWCESEDDAERATAIVGELTGRHPCRAIVLVAEPGRAEPLLAAALNAHCRLAGGGRKQICCEQITIRAAGASVSQLAPTVLSLLEGDLPAVLWWRGNFLERAVHWERLRAVADRLIFDTATWPAAERWLPALASEIARSTSPLYADLNWARLTLWRKLTADCFDNPSFHDVPARIRRVSVAHGHSAGGRLRAMLYAGWVAARLGWPPEQARKRVTVQERTGDDVAEVGIESVELAAGDAVARLHKDFAANTATAEVTMAHVCGMRCQQAFAPLNEAALMSQELDHVAPHGGYERALALAIAQNA
ncbi:MAG: hypothetical protein FJ395_08230 [Verrucomicrobia bacterium]|nr:hypothetical protein [Verrucomicrobiota bacterium]